MLLTLELATRGFVSSLEEEEYELTKIFTRETETELDDEDDENEENKKRFIPFYSEEDREIFDDEEDTVMINEILQNR